jgi:outer membrane protein insertion porin family/translocation and assembly module TamA
MSLWGALRAATLALFATAVSAALPIVLRAQNLGCDRDEQEVRALEFRGNRAVSDGDLALRVATTPSARLRRTLHIPLGEKRCLDRDALASDMLQMKAYYRERGFYGAQVDTLVQQLSPQAVRVVFLIDEGRPTLLRSYAIAGLAGVPDSAEVVEDLRLRAGQPFDFGLFLADVDSIVQRLRNRGYYRADVLHAYDIDYDSLLADVSHTVVPGMRARFGEPVPKVEPVAGRSQQIPDDVVLRVMGIAAGDQYSDRAIVDAQRSLFQLGAYRHIEVTPFPDSLQPPGDTVVILEVRLTEDYMKQLDSEVGWATLDCVRMRLQYTDKNLFGSARRLELTGQASKIGYGEPLQTKETRDVCTLGRTTDLLLDRFSEQMHYFLGATVRQPQLLGTRWVPTASLYSERRGEFRAFLRSTPIGGDFSATRDVRERMPLRLAYTIEYGQTRADDPALCALFNRCDPDSRARIQQLATLGVASAALARVRTDNVISPTTGYATRGELRTSASRLLGTSDSLFFNKATGEIAWYSPVGGGNVLAVRFRGGAVTGRRLSLSERTGFIPPQERLYAGGPTSVRGFQQNELGSLVYIARNSAVDVDTLVGGTDLSFRFAVSEHPDSIRSPERAVPLGGNSLIVANLEYRIRDPFISPDRLQYTLFVDAGDVWTRADSLRKFKWRWTPGFGVRALTPIGPVQVNVGYNPYPREAGAIYFNPDVTTLACATPGNTLIYRRDSGGRLVEQTNAECPRTFDPPARSLWYQKLTFTFSIGPDF